MIIYLYQTDPLVTPRNVTGKDKLSKRGLPGRPHFFNIYDCQDDKVSAFK